MERTHPALRMQRARLRGDSHRSSLAPNRTRAQRSAVEPTSGVAESHFRTSAPDKLIIDNSEASPLAPVCDACHIPCGK